MASASLPSSSSARRWKYDVFLSFQGRDTRKGFTSDLRRRLNKKRIKTFMAHPDIQVGDIFSSTLEEAIKGSRFAIIILSPNYASSTLCLQELTKICQHKTGILPLFFDLNYLKTCFEAAFTNYKNSGIYNSEKLEEWRNALTTVANLSGRDLKDYETERELVKKTVEDICTLVHNIENNRLDDGPLKRTSFGLGGNANLGKKDDLVNRGNCDIVNVLNINQSQRSGDLIRGDRGGDGGYTNNDGFAGVGGPAKGNNTFNYD